MRVIVAGSRSINNYKQVEAAIKNSGFPISTLISGTARGVDRLGEQYARLNNIPVERHPADWDRHGRGAGYIRNREMVDAADAVIVVWDGMSRGSQHTIQIAKGKRLPVHVEKVG